MSTNIKYLNNIGSNKSANLVLFSNEKYNLNNLKKYFSNTEFSYVSDILKTSDLKKNLLVFKLN